MNKEQIRQTGDEEWGSIEHVGEANIEKDADLDGYVEEVEKAGELAHQLPTDDQGQALIAQSSPVVLPSNAVVLPLTQVEFEEGMSQGVFTSARWLAEWCMLMIKKYGQRVFFRG